MFMEHNAMDHVDVEKQILLTCESLTLCLGICHRRAALGPICHFSIKLSTSAKSYSEY